MRGGTRRFLAAAAQWPTVGAPCTRGMHRAAVGATAGDAAHSSGPRVAARIAARWAETPTVTGLRLEVDASQFSFEPGQWIDFWAPGIKQAGGFSICSPPSQLAAGGTFDLGVKATKHPVAEWISGKAATGAQVHVRVGGTFGLAPASLEPGRPSLFVAGGIGVTPLVSMLAALVEHWAAHPQPGRADGWALAPQAVVLYSSRAPCEFALLPRMLDLQEASRGALRLRLHCSEFAPPPPGGGVGVGVGGEDEVAAAAAEEAAAAAPSMFLLRDGVRSLARRRMTAADLAMAVAELQRGAADAAVAAGGGGGPPAKVVAYVCGPPALSDPVVASLEADEGGVQGVVMERWW